MIRRLFTKLPGGLGRINIGQKNHLMPTDIYEYACSFRSVYKRSAPLLKKIDNPDWATPDEINQLYGNAQSLAIQIAFSNELLLKAILLASTGQQYRGHNLKTLVDALDNRHLDIIIKHLEKYGLKKGHLDTVLELSAEIFVDARYGFEGKPYSIDFLTLQLLNEALDHIFRFRIPDWTRLTKSQQKNPKVLKKELNLLFDDEYQRTQRRLFRELKRAFK